MAWEEERVATKRHYYFHYFDQDSVSMDKTFDLGHPFELDKLRVHLSTSHVSVVDFVIYLDHHLSAAYDQTLLSQPMNGIRDVMYQPDPSLKLHQNDRILLSMIMSAANVYGIEISGWAITTGIAMTRD